MRSLINVSVAIFFLILSGTTSAFFGPGFICDYYSSEGLNTIRRIPCEKLSMDGDGKGLCLGVFRYDFETARFERTGGINVSEGLRCGSLVVSREAAFVALIEMHRGRVTRNAPSLMIYSSSGERVISLPLTSLLTPEEIENNAGFGDGVLWFDFGYFNRDSTKFTFVGPAERFLRSRYSMPRSPNSAEPRAQYKYTVDLSEKTVSRFAGD